MSTSSEIRQAKTIPSPFYKIAYAAFVLLGIFYFVVKGAVSESVMYMGLALVFDPFDQSVTWKQRPFYQKAWLIAHLTIVFTLLAIMLLASK